MKWVPMTANHRVHAKSYVLKDRDDNWLAEINNFAEEWRLFVKSENYRGYRHVHTFETHRAMLWALEHPEEFWMELLL